jgi:hypothetical protein
VEAEILRQDGSANLLVKQMIVRPFFSCDLVEGIVKFSRPVNGSGSRKNTSKPPSLSFRRFVPLGLEPAQSSNKPIRASGKASKLRAVCVDVERAGIVAASRLGTAAGGACFSGCKTRK